MCRACRALLPSITCSPAAHSLQLHETFDWAERSRRGLLLLIDEADAFLSELHYYISA